MSKGDIHANHYLLGWFFKIEYGRYWLSDQVGKYMSDHVSKLVRFPLESVTRFSDANPYFQLAEAIEENSTGAIVFGVSYRLMLFVKQHLTHCHAEATPCGIALSFLHAKQAYNIPIVIERLPGGQVVHHFIDQSEITN